MKDSAISPPFAAGRPALAALLLALLSVGAPVAAQPAEPPAPCRQEIAYRLWQEGAGERLFAYGEEIAIAAEEEAHLYVEVKGQADKSLGTSTVIGYPGEFGFGGAPLEVLRQVRMEAQDAADRQYGRIRFRTVGPGGTSLGYRIEAVDPPGQVSLLAAVCRTGQVNLRILPPKPAPPAVEPIAPREAAEQLVVLLYYGLLRRRIVDQFDQGYVDSVLKNGRAGIQSIAEAILESNEFRESAYRRAEERHGPPKRGGKSITELLLADVYDALYGRARPSKIDIQRDLEDLDVCLKGKSWYIETCGRLGITLVASPHFYDHNKDLIDALEAGRGGG